MIVTFDTTVKNGLPVRVSMERDRYCEEFFIEEILFRNGSCAPRVIRDYAERFDIERLRYQAHREI